MVLGCWFDGDSEVRWNRLAVLTLQIVVRVICQSRHDGRDLYLANTDSESSISLENIALRFEHDAAVTYVMADS